MKYYLIFWIVNVAQVWANFGGAVGSRKCTLRDLLVNTYYIDEIFKFCNNVKCVVTY